MPRSLRTELAFHARLHFTAGPEIRDDFVAHHLPAVTDLLTIDFDGQIPAPDCGAGARQVLGVGAGYLYAVVARLDQDDAVVVTAIVVETAPGA